jgi:hypothetical protein
MKIAPGTQPNQVETTQGPDTGGAPATAPGVAGLPVSPDNLTEVFRGAVGLGEQFVAGFFGAGGVMTAAPAKPPYAGPPVMGKYQTQRFHENFNKLTENEAKAFNEKLINANSDTERDYLMKALASNHKITTVLTFADQIHGKSDEWMHKNLRVTGDAANEKGLQQQWSCSCGPTTAEVIRAEMDPIYALTLHRKNKDLTSSGAGNSDVANQQKEVLEEHGGKAVERTKEGGEGMGLEDALNDERITRWTGVTYEGHGVESVDRRAKLPEPYQTAVNNSANKDLKDVVSKLDTDLANGIPCAIRLTDAKNSGGHFVAVTGVTGTGADKTYIIHDVWGGQTHYVKAKDLEAGKVDPAIAGWGEISTFYTSK